MTGDGVMSHWLFWALLSAIFAAMTAIFAKAGVEEIHPDLATLLRTLVVVALLVAIVWWNVPSISISGITAKGSLFLVLSGLGTGLSWFCYFRALKIGKASQVAPIDKLSVVFVGVLAVMILGERLSPGNWVGIMLITAGAICVALS